MNYPPHLATIVALLLLAFGVAYNALVAWLERRGYAEGYTSLLVVGGVGVTLLVVAIVAWPAAVLTLAAFSCSGLPMVVGSWWRHVRNRERGQDAQRKEVIRDAQR